jgi:hypothetical protein
MQTFAPRQNQPQGRVSSSVARAHQAVRTPVHEPKPGLTGPASLTASQAAPSASWDFSKIPIFESEADRAAEHVMRTPDPAAIPPHKRRACACGGTCPSCQGKQPEHVQQTSAFGEQSEAPSIVTEVLRAPGQPFDTATRALMERRFRHDFSRVRLHTDAKANASAVAVNARAYTVGPHIVFKTEQFAPATAEGRKLIVHELAHVVQQGDAGTGIRSALKIGPAGDTHEREAERFAETVVAETPGPLAPEFSPRSSAALSLQRDQCKKSDDHIPTGPLTPPPFNFDCEPSPATLAAVRAVPGVPPTILGITETSMVDQQLTFTEGKGSRCTAAVKSYATLQNTNFLYTKAGDHPDGTEITPAGRACKKDTQVAKVLRVTDKGAEILKLGEKEHCEDHKLSRSAIANTIRRSKNLKVHTAPPGRRPWVDRYAGRSSKNGSKIEPESISTSGIKSQSVC